MTVAPAEPRIRVVLADDQALFRDGLRLILGTAPDIEIVGEAADGEQAVERCLSLSPDVVLMDLEMPRLHGIDAIRSLRERGASCRVLVLTTYRDEASVLDAIAAGALGYVLKDLRAEQILEAVRAAAAGHSPLAPSVASRLVARFAEVAERTPRSTTSAGGLSEREIQVVVLVARGASNKEIASALSISEGTVKNHLTNIFARLGVTDRTQAALRARELGLVTSRGGG